MAELSDQEFWAELEKVDEKALASIQVDESAKQTASAAALSIPYCTEYCALRPVISKIPDILDRIPIPGLGKIAGLIRLLISIADTVCQCG